MLVNQLAVFLENKKGRINQFAKVLADANINLVNMSIADTVEYGILRCVTSDNDLALKVLKENGFNVAKTELVGFEVKNIPGEMQKVLRILNDEEINISYLSSYSKAPDKAVILLKVDDNEKVSKILEKNNINILSESIN